MKSIRFVLLTATLHAAIGFCPMQVQMLMMDHEPMQPTGHAMHMGSMMKSASNHTMPGCAACITAVQEMIQEKATLAAPAELPIPAITLAYAYPQTTETTTDLEGPEARSNAPPLSIIQTEFTVLRT